MHWVTQDSSISTSARIDPVLYTVVFCLYVCVDKSLKEHCYLFNPTEIDVYSSPWACADCCGLLGGHAMVDGVESCAPPHSDSDRCVDFASPKILIYVVLQENGQWFPTCEALLRDPSDPRWPAGTRGVPFTYLYIIHLLAGGRTRLCSRRRVCLPPRPR